MFQKIFIASDHAGVELKQDLINFCIKRKMPCQDLGPWKIASVDYPDFAQKVVDKVLEFPETAGILICGSGVGMSIAANRFSGIRAALCLDAGETAALARSHNNANILCFGARLILKNHALSSLEIFLKTPFEKGRHGARLQKIDSF